MKYRVEVNSRVEKLLAKMPSALARVFRDGIRSLAINPRPSSCIKMKGEQDTYRIRIGNYRIIYEIYDQKLVILLIHVGHRKDVYRKR